MKQLDAVVSRAAERVLNGVTSIVDQFRTKPKPPSPTPPRDPSVERVKASEHIALQPLYGRHMGQPTLYEMIEDAQREKQLRSSARALARASPSGHLQEQRGQLAATLRTPVPQRTCESSIDNSIIYCQCGEDLDKHLRDSRGQGS